MRGLVSYVLGGILVVVAMDFLAPPAGLGMSLAWPAASEQFPAGVNRSHKGDRLTLPASLNGAPSSARPASRMIAGCDPVFSPLSVSARLNYPRQCVADGGPGMELLRAKRVG